MCTPTKLWGIACTSTNVAVLMALSMFSSVAHADFYDDYCMVQQTSIYGGDLTCLSRDPTALFTWGTLTFDHFYFSRYQDAFYPAFVDARFSETGVSLSDDWSRNLFDFIGFTVTVADSAPLLHEMTIDWNNIPVPPYDDGSGVSRATALVLPPVNSALAIAGVCSAGSAYTSCGADNGKSVNRTLFFDPDTGVPVDLRQVQVQVEILLHDGTPFTGVNITFSQVPEPSTLLLLGTAAGMALLLSFPPRSLSERQ